MKLKKKLKYDSPLYTFSIKNGSKLREKDKLKGEIVINPLVRNFFDYNTVLNILNSIIGTLFPEESGGIPGTETQIEITLLNKRIEEKNNPTKNLNLLSEKSENVDMLIEVGNRITSGDTKSYIALNIGFEFFIDKNPIGKARYIIHSSNYVLK